MLSSAICRFTYCSYSTMAVCMDKPTILLVYRNIVYDFSGLFSIRRLFCLGLLVGVSTMDGINYLFQQINPEALPMDFVEEADTECMKLFRSQFKIS